MFKTDVESWVAIASLAGAMLFMSPCRAADGTDLLVENSPQKIPEGTIKATLRGANIVTTSPMFLESAASGVTVPTDVVVATVKANPYLRRALKLPNNPQEITFSDIASATRFAGDVDVPTIAWTNSAIKGPYCGVPKKDAKESWKKLTCDDSAKYNSEVIAKLLVFDGLDTSKTIIHNIGGTYSDYVAIRPNYADALIAGNETMYKINNTIQNKGSSSFNAETSADFAKFTSNSFSEKISKVAFLSDRNVTFGSPYVETSTEAKLTLPQEISANFDVYVLHLAMTWRELPQYDLDELDYYVALPNGSIALELMPLRYGIKVEQKEGTQISPSVEVAGVKVELGLIYGRDVSFTYLRPTIQGYGLQESQFSWSMRDQAVQPGAEQFLCAVGVPKRSKQISLLMSASAHWSGAFAVAGGIESTEQISQTISLH
jgi:hypothetical protein